MPGDPLLLLKGTSAALGPLQRDLVPLYDRWSQDLAVLAGLGQRFADTLELAYQSYEHASNASAREAYFNGLRHPRSPHPRRSGRHRLPAERLSLDNADFTIMLGERRRQGLGTEATRLTLDCAFNIAGLRNVALDVRAPNEAAIRAYEKAGFKTIGRRRNAARWHGQPCDLVLMDAIPEDFTGSVVAPTA